MKFLLMTAIILSSILHAAHKQVWVTPEYLQKDIKIIDIRTKQEWIDTGIVKGAYTITFFDENGNYNVPKFLDALNKIVKKDEEFALICNTASRTGMLAPFLADELGYKVVDLKGGLEYLYFKGYKTVPYK